MDGRVWVGGAVGLSKVLERLGDCNQGPRFTTSVFIILEINCDFPIAIAILTHKFGSSHSSLLATHPKHQSIMPTLLTLFLPFLALTTAERPISSMLDGVLSYYSDSMLLPDFTLTRHLTALPPIWTFLEVEVDTSYRHTHSYLLISPHSHFTTVTTDDRETSALSPTPAWTFEQVGGGDMKVTHARRLGQSGSVYLTFGPVRYNGRIRVLPNGYKVITTPQGDARLQGRFIQPEPTYLSTFEGVYKIKSFRIYFDRRTYEKPAGARADKTDVLLRFKDEDYEPVDVADVEVDWGVRGFRPMVEQCVVDGRLVVREKEGQWVGVKVGWNEGVSEPVFEEVGREVKEECDWRFGPSAGEVVEEGSKDGEGYTSL